MRVLAILIAVGTLALLAPLSAKAGPFEKTAMKARAAVRAGDVTGSCHGCAKSRLQRLVRRLVVLRFTPAGAGAVSTALCVVGGESGFNPGAISHTGDYSLAQFNRATWESVHPDWWRPARGFRYLIFDPGFATNAMWAMSKRGTYWLPWVVYTNGSCR